MQGNNQRYRDFGENELCIFFQVKDEIDETKSDIYMSNSETQIIQIINDISCNFHIIEVLNCPISWLLLCDISTDILYIFDISDIVSIYEATEFEEKLLYKIKDFFYDDTTTYFMDSNHFYYSEKYKGTLIEIEINTG